MVSNRIIRDIYRVRDGERRNDIVFFLHSICVCVYI